QAVGTGRFAPPGRCGTRGGHQGVQEPPPAEVCPDGQDALEGHRQGPVQHHRLSPGGLKSVRAVGRDRGMPESPGPSQPRWPTEEELAGAGAVRSSTVSRLRPLPFYLSLLLTRRDPAGRGRFPRRRDSTASGPAHDEVPSRTSTTVLAWPGARGAGSG